MKLPCLAVYSFFLTTTIQPQDAAPNTPPGLTTRNYQQLFKSAYSHPFDPPLSSAHSSPDDSVRYNMYGDLREDDPHYIQKSSMWSCALGVMLNNVTSWAYDRYLFNLDHARIGFRSWKRNLTTGPVWDTDRFGMNFFFRPYSGISHFHATRTSGYDFYESLPLTFGGSLIWEYFGENTLPSVNDLINTTVTGAFLGEISYRLSSNVLDDRTTGSERVLRELLAAFIAPSRAFSRLLDGNLSRVTSEEIYQQEPLAMTFSAGARLVNNGGSFGTGSLSQVSTIQLEYGNPFEERSRKSFDYFALRADLNVGVGGKILGNVVGQGFLFGRNTRHGTMEMLIGGFQHYDYWDNTTFELGTIAFGGGMIARLPLGARATLSLDMHLGIVPLAGNSTRLGPDTSQFRDYNYGGGAEGKLETAFDFDGWVSVTLRGYGYWIHTYVGNAGDNVLGILKPGVTLRLAGNLRLGFEQLVYFSNRYPRDFPEVHNKRTEQKVFLQFSLPAGSKPITPSR